MTGQAALVVGGGIIGSACALRLQRCGFETMLLDPDREPRPASWGNAGHLAAEQAEPPASPKTLRALPRLLFIRGGPADFRLRDVAAWAPFALRFLRAAGPAQFAAGTEALGALLGEAIPAWRRLAAEIGAPELVVENGHFIAWESAGSAARGIAAWRAAHTGTAFFRPATHEETERLAQLTKAPIAGAVKFERTGQIADLPSLHDALARAAAASGVVRRRGNALRIQREGERARIVTAEGDRLGAGIILIAAGVGSGPLLRGAHLPAPVIAERGYHIESDAGNWPPNLPPVVFEDRSMVVTRFAATLRATSFVEFACPESPPDPRKWRRLRAHAAELGLPFDAPVSEWVGARPTLPDYLPAIGRHPDLRNLHYAFGHQHLGLTLAAITAEVVGDLVCGRPPCLDINPFDLRRFGRPGAAR